MDASGSRASLQPSKSAEPWGFTGVVGQVGGWTEPVLSLPV